MCNLAHPDSNEENEMTKVISLVAAMVVVFALPALAVDYRSSICYDPDRTCLWGTEMHPESPKFGETFTIGLDLDSFMQGDLCGWETWIPFTGQNIIFVDAGRHQTDPEAPVGCEVIPVAWTDDYCPEADSWLHCYLIDSFNNGIAPIVEIDSEVVLTFRVSQNANARFETCIGTDYFYADGRDPANGGACTEVMAEGGFFGTQRIGIEIDYVPEPGEIAGLAASLPLLWVLGRRHARRNK
jgi:hypothetical protein